MADCACAYDPNHVTVQGKRPGPNCACVQLPGSTRSLKLCEECRFNSCVSVFFIPWRSRGLKQWVVTSISHMGEILDSDWSKPNLLRSDWLQPSVASITTLYVFSLLFCCLVQKLKTASSLPALFFTLSIKNESMTIELGLIRTLWHTLE